MERALVSGDRDRDIAGSTGTPRCGEQRFDGAHAPGGDSERERPVDESISRFAEHGPHGAIGVEDLEGGCVDDQNAVARELEEQAIASFDMTQPPVVALHGLLRFNQSLLERRHMAHVTADGNNFADVAQAKRGI